MKKKLKGYDYWKPLVCPIWFREAGNGKGEVLYEEFVKSFIKSEIIGERCGDRSFEIRLYFQGGEG